MKDWPKFKIRIKAKFHNISPICAHAPTEEKDDAVKNAFYTSLEDLYDKCPAHNIKIVFGGFNAKVGQEGIFGPTVGQFSLHPTTSPNFCSTRFQLLDIQKATWLSHERSTRNQIDHVVIDGRHVSNAHISWSQHGLASRAVSSSMLRKLNVKKL